MDNHDKEETGAKMAPVEELDNHMDEVRDTDELPVRNDANTISALDNLGDEVAKTQAEEAASTEPAEQELTFPSGEYHQTPRNPSDGFGDFEVVNIVQKIHSPEMMERAIPYPPVMLLEDPKMAEDHSGNGWRASMIFDHPVDGVAAVYFWSSTPEGASALLFADDKVKRFLVEQKARVEEYNRDDR